MAIYNNIYIVAIYVMAQNNLSVKNMSRPLFSFLVVVWLVAGSFPVLSASDSEAPAAAPAPSAYMDESNGRFDWLNPYPTGNDLRDVAWSPDGSKAILVGYAGTIIEWDGLGFDSYYTGTGLNFNGVAWWPDATYALIIGDGGRLLKLQDGELSEISTGTTVTLTDISINPNVGQAIIVGEERTVLVYDGESVTTVSSGGKILLTTVSWEPGGSYAMMAGYETANQNPLQGTILQYWPENATFKTRFAEFYYRFQGGAFSPNAETAVFSATYQARNNNSGRLLMWDGMKMTETVSDLQPGLTGVGWTPDGQLGYVVGTGNLVEFDFDGIPTGNTFDFFVQSAYGAFSYMPDGSEAIVVGSAGLVRRFDGAYMERLGNNVLTDVRATINGAAWSPDGSTLVMVGDVSWVIVYDGESFSLTRVQSKGRGVNYYGVAWQPDGDYALIVGENGAITKYMADGTFDNNIQSNTVKTFRAVAWEPNGTYALIVGDSGTVRKYDGVKTTPVPSGTDYTLRGVAFTPGTEQATIVGGDVRTVTTPTGQADKKTAIILHWGGNIINGRSTVADQLLNSVTFDPMIMTGDNGYIIIREPDNSDAIPDVSVHSNLRSAAWLKKNGNVPFQDALVVGDAGTAMIVRNVPDSAFATAKLHNTTTTLPLTTVAMRPQGDYAICVGAMGTILKYTPNLPPTAVTVKAENITDNALDLSWTENADRDFYRYEVMQSKTLNFTGATAKTLLSSKDRTVTSVLVKGLTKQTVYYFKVIVTDNAGLKTESNILKVTTLLGNIAPAAVKLGAPYSLTCTTMSINWTRNNDGDFARYELHKSVTKNFNISMGTIYANISDQNTTDRLVSDLTFNTTYYYKMRVVDTGGLYNDSNQVNATTASVNIPPAAVVLSAPTEISDITMKLTWTQSGDSDFAKYELYMSNESGFNLTNATLFRTFANQSTTSYTVEGLTNNTTYYFRMRVLDTGDLYNDSNEVTGTTTPPNAPPSPVVLSEPVEVGTTTVSLEWTVSPERDFKQYEVHFSTQEGFNITSGTAAVTLVDKNQTTYTVTGLSANTTYFFKVRIKDTSNLFANSNEVNATTLLNAPPHAVALYWPVNITESSMELEWGPSAEVDFLRYELHMSPETNFTPAPSTLVAQVSGVDAVIYNVTGLEANTTYYFRIRVFDTGLMSNDSNEVNGTTLGPDLPPVAVTLADPDEITENTTLLEWTQNRDADFAEYVVHKGTSPSFTPSGTTEVTTLTNVGSTRYNVTGLKANTTYYYKIQVNDLGGKLNLSNEVRARTLALNILPVCDAGGDRFVTVDVEVKFKATASDPDGTVVKYLWDFNGDGTYDSDSASSSAAYTYNTVGVYVVTLMVQDNRGGNTTAIANITVEPAIPPNVLPTILDIGEEIFAYIGEEVFFPANFSDSDGYITKVQWDFDGDGTYDYESADEANITVIYDTAGNYTAVFKVTDNRAGSVTKSKLVQIVRFNNAPEARITSPSNNQKFYTTDLITLSSTGTIDVDGDKMTYVWTNTRDGKKLGTSASLKLTLAKGDYAVELAVSDGELTGTAYVNFSVSEKPNVKPTVKIEAPGNNSIAKSLVSVSGSAKDDKKVEKVEVRIDPSGSWLKASGTRTWSYEIDTKPLAQGAHRIYARSYDGIDYSDEYYIIINVDNPVAKTATSKSFIPGFDAGMLGLALMAVAALAFSRRQRRD
jgi:PKD repeat protein